MSIDPKEVVLATLGASAGLAGFVLVFLGIIITSYESFSGGTPDQVVRPYKATGAILLVTFAFSLGVVGLCLIWLALGGPSPLYGWTVVLFLLQLVLVFLAAGWSTRMVLWR
jgi:hypothetical protein